MKLMIPEFTLMKTIINIQKNIKVIVNSIKSHHKVQR